jgi:hypothetical protein
MADYYSVISRAVAALETNTFEDRAPSTIAHAPCSRTSFASVRLTKQTLTVSV